jgi:hypothetical protein
VKASNLGRSPDSGDTGNLRLVPPLSERTVPV